MVRHLIIQNAQQCLHVAYWIDIWSGSHLPSLYWKTHGGDIHNPFGIALWTHTWQDIREDYRDWTRSFILWNCYICNILELRSSQTIQCLFLEPLCVCGLHCRGLVVEVSRKVYPIRLTLHTFIGFLIGLRVDTFVGFNVGFLLGLRVGFNVEAYTVQSCEWDWCMTDYSKTLTPDFDANLSYRVIPVNSYQFLWRSQIDANFWGLCFRIISLM